MISTTVTGNLGQDAELKYHDGNPILSFSLASRRYDGKTKEEVTDWVNVSFWGKRGESIAKYLTKGSRAAVRGSMWVRTYEKKDGTPGWSLECRADDIELLGQKDKPADTGVNHKTVSNDPSIPF